MTHERIYVLADDMADYPGGSYWTARRRDLDDIEYVRADLLAAAQERLNLAQEKAREWRQALDERDAAQAEAQNAAKRAEYWKAEHLAANRVIDELQAEARELREKLRDAANVLIEIGNRHQCWRMIDRPLERFEATLKRTAALSRPAAEQHPDDAAVDRFAQAMKAKMAASRAKGRGGWDDPAQCSVESLEQLFTEHCQKRNDGWAVDVANFAMMLWHRQPAADQPAELKCERCGGPTERDDNSYQCHRCQMLWPQPAERESLPLMRCHSDLTSCPVCDSTRTPPVPAIQCMDCGHISVEPRPTPAAQESGDA